MSNFSLAIGVSTNLGYLAAADHQGKSSDKLEGK